MAWVYILKSEKNKYYIGSTSDLQRRMLQHRNGQTHTTKRMRNFRIVFAQKYNSLNTARKVERKLKSWKRKDYIERIIKDRKINYKPSNPR